MYDKMSLLTDSSYAAAFAFEGTWSVVNHTEINGRQLFELESDNYGYTPEVGHIIADVDGSVLAENVHNGFENFYLEKQRKLICCGFRLFSGIKAVFIVGKLSFGKFVKLL